MDWILEWHRSDRNLSISSIFHRSALCFKYIARCRCRQFFKRRLLLQIVIITSFDLWCASYLPKFLLLLADVINHCLMTIFFFFFLSVLLLFLFQTSHVPRLSTLRDNLCGRSLADNFDLGHNLNINHLLIHYISLVEHILRSRHLRWCITCYPRCLLLIYCSWFLLLDRRRGASA